MKQTVWPHIGEAMPKRGNAFTKALTRFLLRIFGWQILGKGSEHGRMVLVGAPHTSNWDFILTIAAMFALGVEFSWVAKHSVFVWPLKPLMIWLGGIPLDRQTSKGFVDQVVEEFEKRDKFLVAIMPEGTRSKVREWKTGFYFIAHQAQVPLYMIIFDYGKKELRIGPEMITSGNFEEELPIIQSYFKDAKGKISV